GGIHTYLLNLLPELARQGSAHTFFLYADTKAPFDLEGRLPGNVTLRRLGYLGELSALQNDWRVRQWMGRDQVDVAHHPANYGLRPHGARHVITLHDALTVMPLRQVWQGAGSKRTLRGSANMVHLAALSGYSVRRADAIVTISQHAASEIGALLPEVRPRLHVVYHGVPSDAQPLTDPSTLADVKQRLGLPPRFILADGLKNPAVVLGAWQQLPLALRQQVRLLFFARTANLLPAVQNAVDSGAAHLLIRPTRSELIALYSLADLFCFPSWIEGFGLPILEAMACGTPVVASTRAAIPEVAGDAALLADAEDSATISCHFQRLLCEPGLSQQMRQRGLARAAEFSWPRAASELLQIYHQLV
ncbi:MAG: glycosyltransferase family 4 protein, partial [Caldilineaceae bacterium]